MRRLFTAILFVLLVLPFAASARGQTLGWELTDGRYIDVYDLDFRFYYPTGWVYNIDNRTGITIADSQETLDDQIDDDPNTTPQSLVIVIRNVPLKEVGLDEDSSLNKVADYALKLGEITQKERSEISVLSRRTILISGSNSVGREVFATVWVQNRSLVLLGLGTPDAQPWTIWPRPGR